MRLRIIFVAWLAGVLTAAAGPAFAQAGWYAGLALGSSNVDLSPDVVAVSGATSTSFVSDQRDPGVKVFAGYRFNRHFALEGGYAWLGEFQATTQVTAPSSGALNADIRIIGLFVDALAILPLGERFAAFAKVGVLGSETRTFRSTSGTATPAPGVNTNASTDDVDLSYGLGAQYDFAKNVTLRVEWQLYADVGDANTGQTDVNLYAAGLLFRF
ncbi:MAG TPA: outer membrane beta-barrel protein [Burkholderiales bacterium]